MRFSALSGITKRKLRVVVARLRSNFVNLLSCPVANGFSKRRHVLTRNRAAAEGECVVPELDSKRSQCLQSFAILGILQRLAGTQSPAFQLVPRGPEPA